MKKTGKMRSLLLILACCMLTSSVAFARGGGGRGERGERGEQAQGERGERGERGTFDRSAMQERILEMMKERLGATDEEWTVIEPRLKEVMTLTQNASSNNGMRLMMRGNRGNQGNRGNRQQTTTETPDEPVAAALQELTTTLSKEAPTAAEIKAKLAALRGARETNKQKLVTAREQLKLVLSVKQEALLVVMGYLE